MKVHQMTCKKLKEAPSDTNEDHWKEEVTRMTEQLKTKDEQLKTKDEQLKTKDEQLRAKDEQILNLTNLIFSGLKSRGRE